MRWATNPSRSRCGRSHGRFGHSSRELPWTTCIHHGPPNTFCNSATPVSSSRRDEDSCRTFMKREILINASQRETRVAILEDDQLVELLVDRPEARRMVGDIYLGKVEAVLPGIQAAFVNIGTEKSSFLHASDVLEDDSDEDEDPDDKVDADDPRDLEATAGNGAAATATNGKEGNGHGGGH